MRKITKSMRIGKASCGLFLKFSPAGIVKLPPCIMGNPPAWRTTIAYLCSAKRNNYR